MRAVQDAALDLFEARGFDGVTVEEVATRAEVSPSTVYRHFGTKESLVLWDETYERRDAALHAHLDGATPFDGLRAAFVESIAGLSDSEVELQHRRGRLVDDEPALAMALAGSLERDRRELQRIITSAYGREGHDLEMELVARIAMACMLAGFEGWQRAGRSTSLTEHVDQAFEAARGAVA